MNAELGSPAALLDGRPLSEAALPFRAVAEQTAFLSLVTLIFARVLGQGGRESGLLVVAAICVIRLNVWIRHRRVRLGGRWQPAPLELAWRVGMAAAVLSVGALGVGVVGASPDPLTAGIFLVLIPLLLTLGDRSRAIRRVHELSGRQGVPRSPVDP
jgi:hypothetical protein